MKLKILLFRFVLVTFVFLSLSISTAQARTINSITLNGGSNVTVSPSGTLSAVINVTVSGTGANNRWYSTEWTIGSETDCVNHDNHSDETANESFVVTTPSVPGIYNALFKVYGNDNCAGNNNTQMSLPNAVEVVSAPVSMVVDYLFDELLWTGATGEVHDSSGNDYHATAVNGPLTEAVLPAIPGNPGTCSYGVFDGEDDYVALPSNYPNITNSFTITAWIKTRDNTRSGQRIFIDDPNNSQGFGFSLGDGGTGRVRFYSRSTSPIILDTPNVVENDTWYFVAAAADLDAKTKQIYVFDQSGNKIADVSGTYSGNWGFDTGDASMGGENVTSGESSRNFHFEGNLDEIRVHGGALSEAVIRGHQNRSRFCFNQAAEYRFDMCSETQTVIDDSGNGFDGTVLNGPLAIQTGQVCNAGYFDGVDDYVVIDDRDAFDGTSALTIAGWINPENIRTPPAGTNARGVLSKRDNASSNVAYGIFFYSSERDGKLYVDIDGTNNRFASGDAIEEGVWTHFAVVFDGSLPADERVKLYLNGNLDRIATESSTTIPDYGSNLYLGNLYYGTSELKVYQGLLDEIRIVPEVLSSTDVQALMNYTRLGCQSCSSIDHIRIEHDGSGLTCQSETITIRACADANCDIEYLDEVTVNLTSPTSGWSPDPVTFSGGSATVELVNTSAGTVTLDAEATAPTASDTVCINSSVGLDCEMVFTDVGVLIDGDDSDADPESPIVAQIAGKPSNVAPPNPALRQRIRIVRTDDQTGACVAGFSNETLDATFQYLVPIADQGLADNTITIAGNTGADLTAAGNGASVELTFEGDGTAPFHFVSADVGRYSLQVDLEIPVVDAAGDPTGETIPATDTSNPFVVRPLAVFADATVNPKAQSAAGDVFKKAGESFPLNYKSLRWTAGRDGNNDGLWDDCNSSTLATPGASLARVPAWIIGQPGVDLVLPAGGNNPVLNYADGNVSFDAGESEVTVNNVSYREVGIVQLRADGMNAFLGENVEVCSSYIGRFTPDHFVIENILPGTLNSACNTFTYTEQMIEGYVVGAEPKFTVKAQNALDPAHLTQNYTGDFAKLEAADIGLGGPLGGSDADQFGVDEVNKVQVDTWLEIGTLYDNSDGTLAYTAPSTDEYMYLKDNARISPFAARILLQLNSIQDIDGVSAIGLPQDVEVGGTEIRYGRVSLENAYGSELLDLNVPMKTEYFYQGWFQVNTDDDCTELNLTDHLELNLDIDDETGWVDGTNSIAVGNGSTSATIGNSPVDSGDAGLVFTSPGTENDGSFYVRTNVGSDYPWLLYDWNNDGNQTNPTAKATFGIYKGNPRLIYMRESVW